MNFFRWGQSSSKRAPFTPQQTHGDSAWKRYKAGDYHGAAELFDEWTGAEPNSALAWFGYAWSKFQLASQEGVPPEELLVQFHSLAEKSLALNDVSGELEPHQLAGTHALLGLVDKFSGKQNSAEAHFRKAIAVGPESAFSVQARTELAELSLQNGDVVNAERLLREALRLAPDNSKILEGLKALENRRGGIRVRFKVLCYQPLKVENIDLVAGLDETLGEIAAKEFPKYHVSSTGVRFIYSGDNALPSDIYFGNRERYETLRQIGIKEGDTILCMAAGSPIESESYHIRLIRDHLKEGRPALAKRETKRVIELANTDLRAGELEQVLATAQQLLKILPDQPDASTLLARVREAIARRDAGSACAVPGSWTHGHGSPSRTTQAARGPSPPLELAWSFRLDGETLTMPVVASGKLYAGSSSQYVYCFDAQSGEEQWRWRAHTVLEQAPAATATSLYISDREVVTCLDSNTGVVIWQHECRGPCSPVVLGCEAFVATVGGELYRLDAATGKTLAILDSGLPELHSLAADCTRVVALSSSCVFCADAALQKMLWKREGAFGETMPVLAWDAVYVGTQRDGLWCLDANSGLLRWIFSTEAPVKAAPAAAKGRLFFGDVGGRFGCVDAASGALLWRPGEWLTNEIACSTAPAAADPFVYVLLDNGALYALDMLSGHEVWSGVAFEGERGFGSLAATPQAIYAASHLGALVCFGTRDWACRAGSESKKAASIPARSNLVELKDSAGNADPTGIKIRDFGRPTALSGKESDSLNQAMYFAMKNRLDEAIAILQRLQHDHPDEQIVLYNLGNVYDWQGLVGEALAVWDHLLELDPGDSEAFAVLGRLLRTHPDLITEVFGEPRPAEPGIAVSVRWPPKTDVVPVLVKGRAGVACRLHDSLAGALTSGPVWYWWQLIETRYGPVLRLYLEFNYQPYRCHQLLQPLHTGDSQVAEWLDFLENQDAFLFLYFDEDKFSFARQLSHGVEQRDRLHSIRQRAELLRKNTAAAEQDFEAARSEAEARWEERRELGKRTRKPENA